MSIVDTACGTVVRTRDVAGFVAAVWLRRVAPLPPGGGIVLLDASATHAAAPIVVVAAVADLAARVRTHAARPVCRRSPA